jgi:hypothetical protein
MDVYDGAVWSSLVELTARSVNSKGAAIDIPDFTRGGWRTAKPLETIDFDASPLGIF